MKNEQISEALENIRQNLSELEPAIKHVNMASEVTRIVGEIPQKHADFLNELKTLDLEHKNELKSILENETKEILRKNDELIVHLQKSIESENQFASKLESYSSEISEYINKLNSIDFPSRLDKLDSNVASINQVVNNLHSKLDNIERDLRDQIRDMEKELKDQLKLALQHSSERQKEIKMNKRGITIFKK